ncbi:polysaccharide deacetylase family protein [Streptomyces sp. NPDC047985]|uniref:polysaccharide deacetylase family protein n=1 Tax=Streptomyces sp. NPDC047985 TaxID=3155384 RepID=UPI00342A778E
MNASDGPVRRRRALCAGAGAVLAGLAAGCADRRDAPGASARATAAGARPGKPATGTGRPPAPRPAPLPQRFPGQPAQIDHGPRDRPRAAPTFHGQGDPALARAVLAEVGRVPAGITVLAVGSRLDAHPDTARRILDGGHDLGNHTRHHVDICSLGEAAAYEEITGCAGRLRRLTGSIGSWFRPAGSPYATPLVQRLAARAGYPHVLSCDVDSLDFTSPGAAAASRKVAGEIRNGSVVRPHLGYADTVPAPPLLLAEIDRGGLRAVTTTELLT